MPVKPTWVDVGTAGLAALPGARAAARRLAGWDCASLIQDDSFSLGGSPQIGSEARRGEPVPDALLEVRDLTVHWTTRNGVTFPAVKGASFSLSRGEAVGLVGESGCGKSTTALALGGLLPGQGCAVRGSARFHGRDLFSLPEQELEKIRGAEIAFIFQEPGLTLHPMKRIRDQVADVLRVHRRWSRQRVREEVDAALADVSLGETARIGAAYPHQLSGGQRQRVVIALAVACRPALVIADEPTAALDATTQAEILTLFKELTDRRRIALLLITHNPAILPGLAQRVLVMYAGRIVEEGPLETWLRDPLHPYSRALLRSLPAPPGRDSAPAKQPLPLIAGSPPDMASLPQGCAFEPRCPVRMEICFTREPGPVLDQAGRTVRCFHYGS